ncbi:MAG: tRNA pseudouridine(55) synthase TruB [Scytonema sp. PMC 1069.18]|nr:tRNA pseudouridine(55) synthase TruB [Scytonema sp. PMC 1069.18]MEC4887337.1 tRNA pseudouridine(55) synthase TruB [Scytonema sp. PMC 1070.18]
MQGFLNINKAYGWTSHDCVAKTRKLLHIKRIGHAGTLDPAATGVLPIAIGKATRLLQYLPGEKVYKATIRLGVRTTTDDLQGDIITSQPCTGLSPEVVKMALQQFVGKIEQVPPMYSAIQVQGKRLYDLARQGETVEVPVRTVEIFQLECVDWREGEFPELDVAIACGAGTYIRSIARDLGTALETGGTLAALIRTESSGFHLANSLALTDLEAQLQAGAFQPLPPDSALQHLVSITLPTAAALKWCQGQRVSATPASSGILRVYREDGLFLGIGKAVTSDDGPLLIPEMVFESV